MVLLPEGSFPLILAVVVPLLLLLLLLPHPPPCLLLLRLLLLVLPLLLPPAEARVVLVVFLERELEAALEAEGFQGLEHSDSEFPMECRLESWS